MDEITHKVFGFEGFALDVMRRSLRHGNRDVELRPKSFSVLVALVEKAGQLVTKDELIASIWRNVVVTDESLTRCVSDVRLALSDSKQKIIKTVPGRGYLFAAPVFDVPHYEASAPLSPVVPTTGSAPDALQSKSFRIGWISLAITVLLLSLISAIWFWRGPSGLLLPDRPSVAVLPFANLSGDPQQDYFSDGISEDLTTSLSKFAELFVIARDSSFKYKGQHVSLRQIGRELGVRYLLQGSARLSAERVRITAQLVEAATGAQLWAERYDSHMAELFAVQDEITQKIAVSLVAHINKSELNRSSGSSPETVIAHHHTARGNALLQATTPGKHGETIATARGLYEQAVATDPRYAPAILGLATTYFRAWVHASPDHAIGGEYRQQDILDRAESLARRAVELDRTSAKGYALLGWVLHWQDRPQEGIAAFERAFELNPNFVDGRFGALLSQNGHAPEAIEYLRRAMRLDPFYSPICLYYLGMAHFFVERDKEALEIIKSAGAQMPDHRPTGVMLAALSAQLGQDKNARAAAADVLQWNPEFGVAHWVRSQKIRQQLYVERLTGALRKAGLPD